MFFYTYIDKICHQGKLFSFFFFSFQIHNRLLERKKKKKKATGILAINLDCVDFHTSNQLSNFLHEPRLVPIWANMQDNYSWVKSHQWEKMTEWFNRVFHERACLPSKVCDYIIVLKIITTSKQIQQKKSVIISPQ